MQGSYSSIGAKYVSGDITFNVGISDGDAVDEVLGTGASSGEDSSESVGASVDYVIASGVTGTVGFSNQQRRDENKDVQSASGSSWYVGATVSF
jgi:hypothetical protein